MPKNEWEAILKWVKYVCIDSLILSLSDADFTSCRPWLSGSEPDTKPMLIALLKWSDYMLAPTMKTYATCSILAHRDFHAAEILYLALNCDVKNWIYQVVYSLIVEIDQEALMVYYGDLLAGQPFFYLTCAKAKYISQKFLLSRMSISKNHEETQVKFRHCMMEHHYIKCVHSWTDWWLTNIAVRLFNHDLPFYEAAQRVKYCELDTSHIIPNCLQRFISFASVCGIWEHEETIISLTTIKMQGLVKESVLDVDGPGLE
jgi:hypothetical protein